LTVAAALAVGAVAAAAAIFGDTGRRRGGPLACKDCGYASSSVPLDIGKAGTYGIIVVRNPESDTAVLERVVYRELTPGLEMLRPLALRLGDYRRGGLASGLTLTFPPPGVGGAARPLAGFPVEHHRTNKDDVELLLGFSPRRKGVFSYDALDLYYHVGKVRFVTTYHVGLKICAPTAAFGPGKRKCEAKALG
jgi:hypothetical protein